MRGYLDTWFVALVMAAGLVFQPAMAAQEAEVTAPEAPFKWLATTSAEGRLSADFPCKPHRGHGQKHLRGIDKPVEFEQLWCAKATGFAAMGGSASFDVRRYWVSEDPALTQKAFELSIAARGAGIRLAGFPSDRLFWSADEILVMTRQTVGCTWGMEFVHDGSWGSATVTLPQRFCISTNRAFPSETVLHFFNSTQVAGQ